MIYLAVKLKNWVWIKEKDRKDKKEESKRVLRDRLSVVFIHWSENEKLVLAKIEKNQKKKGVLKNKEQRKKGPAYNPFLFQTKIYELKLSAQ